MTLRVYSPTRIGALVTALLAVAAISAVPQAVPLIVVDHATIIDGTGRPAIKNGAIVIQGERIQQIGTRENITPGPGTMVIDATGKFVIPGLIDAHVHFDQSGDVFTRPDAVDLRKVRSYADELTWTKARLPVTFMRYLASGVTSVVDMGGPLWTFEVRDRATKATNAPRVAVAGPLISTASELQFVETDPPVIVATSPGMARDLVRQNARRHPDLTKILFIRGGGESTSNLRSSRLRPRKVMDMAFAWPSTRQSLRRRSSQCAQVRIFSSTASRTGAWIESSSIWRKAEMFCISPR